MKSKTHIFLLCLILTFAISGCGEREPGIEEIIRTKSVDIEEVKGVVIKPAGSDVEVMPGGATAGGPPVMTAMPMIMPPKDVVLEEGEILVADFEGWPNNLGGEMGAYGALEPDWEQVNVTPYSWVYEPIVLGYDPVNVQSGNNSFRLVNCLGLKRDLVWGSFSMDLGPTIDLTLTPKKIESLDVSGYKYLTFWAKGNKGTEKMELLIRDSHALNYSPQVRCKLSDLTTEWQKIVVPLEELTGKVDLTQLDNIGVAFGKDVGNMEGDIAYIDDFVFTNSQ